MKRVSLPLALVALTFASPLTAQDPCDALILRGMNEFETERRVQLLVEALNPAPTCASWPVAVLALAQTLVEDGRDSLAAVWLRWAARRDRDLQPDTLQVLPKVVEAYRAARSFVTRSHGAGDSLVATQWLWPGSGGSEGVGRLQTNSAVSALRVEIAGSGVTGLGGSVPLAAGSYVIATAAAGFDSLRVTREVLPGVTTVLEIRPRRTTVQVAQAAPAGPTIVAKPPTPTGTVAPPKPKKFPVLLVVGGVVAAGVAVAVIAGGPDDPTTGGITITFPAPP